MCYTSPTVELMEVLDIDPDIAKVIGMRGMLKVLFQRLLEKGVPYAHLDAIKHLTGRELIGAMRQALAYAEPVSFENFVRSIDDAEALINGVDAVT